MKVLFAVSNDEISESIVKRYQKNYKEIIKAFKEGNISDYMSDDQLIAIYNLLDDEKRTTSCNSFRGDGKTNKFYNM